MHLNTCVSILLGLALCLKAAPLSTGHAKVSFVEHSNHKFGATEVDRIHRYIRDGVIFAKLASGDHKIDIPTDIPDANWIAFEIESSSQHCAPKTCKGVLYWDFWDALDRREAVMEIRDQHGIVMAEIGPGPKDNPTLNPQDAQKIYFDGTYEDPKGVHQKSYSVKS